MGRDQGNQQSMVMRPQIRSSGELSTCGPESLRGKSKSQNPRKYPWKMTPTYTEKNCGLRQTFADNRKFSREIDTLTSHPQSSSLYQLEDRRQGWLLIQFSNVCCLQDTEQDTGRAENYTP